VPVRTLAISRGNSRSSPPGLIKSFLFLTSRTFRQLFSPQRPAWRVVGRYFLPFFRRVVTFDFSTSSKTTLFLRVFLLSGLSKPDRRLVPALWRYYSLFSFRMSVQGEELFFFARRVSRLRNKVARRRAFRLFSPCWFPILILFFYSSIILQAFF